MALTANERAINEVNKDNDEAKNYVNAFLTRTNNELFARALKLNSAMDQLVRFMALPKGSQPPSFWEAAFSAFALVFPELTMLKYVEETSKAAELAVAIAKASETSAKLAKTVTAVQKSGEVVKKVAEIKETVDKHIEAGKQVVESVSDEEKPPNPLSQFSGAASGPVDKLIESSNVAAKAWEDATNALHAEYSKRLDQAGDKAQPQQSMTNWIKGILKPLPRALNKDELNQLERLYLWYLIGTYVRTSVYFGRKTTEIHRTYHGEPMNFRSGSVSLVGLNDTQIDTIFDLFGSEAPRGSIFIQPPVWNINIYLAQWNVQTRDA